MVTNNKIERSKLMDILWDIQTKRGCIEHDDITKIADEFDLSRMDVEGVVSFFHFFHKTDVGKYTIYLNNSVVSKFAHMDKVQVAFEKATGTSLGHVSKDGMFGLFETACIGLSDQEPACLINLKPFTNLTPETATAIITD